MQVGISNNVGFRGAFRPKALQIPPHVIEQFSKPFTSEEIMALRIKLGLPSDTSRTLVFSTMERLRKEF